MCGIAGIIGGDKWREKNSRIQLMLEVLRHRGPDDIGIETWNNAVLGHRRLSVFDLSKAGHQPMLSNEGDIGVVFNGAIYNFKVLRSELEKKGFRFRSLSDTEVLIYGYKEWGIRRLVNKLDGMFAIGLWDDRNKSAFLVRDRLGVKPLAYAVEDGVLAFASTIRALKMGGFGGGLNKHGLAEYLEFGFLTDEHSIYEGIRKVAAGQIIEWNRGEINEREYWKPASTPARNDVSFEDAVEETENLFLQAVEKRLQADVPIGALLSGGIDSSLVCWAIAKLGGDVTAFTVGTPNDKSDESSVAAKTAKLLDVKHEILPLSSEKPPNISELVAAFPEPFACASALGMLEISSDVKKSATVLLTGDGGDDVFLGYPEHKHFFLSERVANKTPQFVGDLWRKTRGAIPRVGTLKRGVSFLDYSFGGLGGVTNARDGLPVYRRNNLLGDALREITIPDRQIEWTIESGRNLLAEFLSYDRRTRFVGEYLPKIDGSTMFHALEARSPFLDIKLWEYAASLPFHLRLFEGRSKAILRELVRRHIGEDLANGRKQGFVIPVQKWLTGHWRKHFADLLSDSILEEEGLINMGAAKALLEKSISRNWAPRQLWFIFVLESWMRHERDHSIQ